MILCTFTRARCESSLLIYKNRIFISMRCASSSPELMQQAPESSSWHGSGWHAPPPSSAFFLSSSSQSQRGSRLHMEDSPPSVPVQTIVRWQTLNNRCPPFLSHASRCNVHLASHPNPAIPAPSGTGSNTRHPPPRFSKHPCRLLISPL